MASISSQIVRVRRNTIDIIDPMISDLCHPKVYSFDFPLLVNARAQIPNINAIKSVAKCAQSVAIAIELAR